MTVYGDGKFAFQGKPSIYKAVCRAISPNVRALL